MLKSIVRLSPPNKYMMNEEVDDLLEEEEEADVSSSELTHISLEDNIQEDALTIEQALAQAQEEPEMTILRDRYMLQIQDAMRTFKRLHQDSQHWSIVGNPR